jgi:hypothetical protein
VPRPLTGSTINSTQPLKAHLFQAYPDGPEGKVERVAPRPNRAVVFDGQSTLHGTTYTEVGGGGGSSNGEADNVLNTSAFAVGLQQNWSAVQCAVNSADDTARLIYTKGKGKSGGGSWSVVNSEGLKLLTYPADKVMLKATWVADADDGAARARHAAASATQPVKSTKYVLDRLVSHLRELNRLGYSALFSLATDPP